MTLIEGVGDEVIWMMVAAAVVLIACLAWLSTAVGEGGAFVSVIVIDRERFAALLRNVRGRVIRIRSYNEPRENSSARGRSDRHISHTAPSRESVDVTTANSETSSSASLQSSEENSTPHPAAVNQQLSPSSASVDEPISGVESANQAIRGNSGSSNDERDSLLGEGTGDLVCSAGQAVDDTKQQMASCDSSDKKNVITGSRSLEAHVNVQPPVVTGSTSLTGNLGQVRTGVGSPSASSTGEGSSKGLVGGGLVGASEESVASVPSLSTADGQVRIRLQFIDGQQRFVESDPDSTLGAFKREHFADQLSSNSKVRFIVNGQELRDDSVTLRAYSITDGSVIHCLVTRAPAETQNANAHQQGLGGNPFDVGVLMFPLFGAVLALLWYARIMYRGFFNAASTISLIAISFLYCIALLATTRGRESTAHRTADVHAHVD